MGIKNLTRFLTQQFPELLEDVTLKDFAGKKIAIDTAIFMCKFKASSGKNWLDAFVSLVSWMWECGVTPIFVLDNGSPPEKAIEKKKRYEAKKKSLEKIAALEKAIETYKVDKIVTPLLKEVHQKESKNEENSRRKSLLLRPHVRKKEFNLAVVESKLARMKSHLFTITPSDWENLKALFDVLKIEWIVANGEGEKHCAWMVNTKNASAVLSEDSDCLAYGVETFLLKPNFSKKSVKKIIFSKLLQSLELSKEEFVDFCIMCGTDYNPNIKKIGVKRSFELIQKHRSIESVGKEGLDIAVLTHEGSRLLFALPDEYSFTETKQEEELTNRLRPSASGLECRMNKTEVATFFFQKNMKSDVHTIDRINSDFVNSSK